MTSVAEAVVARLADRGLSVATAESLTGGLVVAALVSVPGASRVVRGAVVAYDERVKAEVLGVDPRVLREHGAVHPEVARQMAVGVRAALAVEGEGVDVGIATTGIAGPTSPDGQPVGTVDVAVSIGAGCVHRRYRFEGSREQLRQASVDAALRLSLDILIDQNLAAD